MESSDKNRRGQLHSIIDRLIIASAGKVDTETKKEVKEVKDVGTDTDPVSEVLENTVIESQDDKRKKKRKGEPRQLISSETEIPPDSEDDIPMVVIHIDNQSADELFPGEYDGYEDEGEYDNETFVVNAADASDYEVDESELVDSDDSYKPKIKKRGRKKTKRSPNTKKKTKRVKDDNAEVDINCEYCSEVFTTEKAYKSHLQKHADQRPFKCSICQKGFKRQSHVKRHEILHTGEKPYVCNICGRGFTQGPHLKSHLQTHAGDELFQQKELEEQKRNITKILDKNKSQGSASKDGDNETSELTICTCSLCGFKFTSEKQLKNHLQKHANQRPFKCKTCNKPFKQMNHLRRHEIIHTGARPYICHICDKGFTQSAHLKAHIRIHTGERPYKCKYCDRGFIDYSQCRRHIMTHTGQRPFPCDVCGRAFSQRSNLLKHQQTQHNGSKKMKKETDDPDAGPPDTDLDIKTEGEVKNEPETGAVQKDKKEPNEKGSKDYTCNVCGKSFQRGSNLRAHMVFHNGVRPHKCDHCGKGFYQSSHHKRHMLIHTGDRPFVCDVCGRGFTQSPHLYAHRRIHTGETPFECKTCGKKFKDNSCYRRHERTHSGEKEYACQDCGKKFTQRTGLVRHIRVHTGERPYSCRFCCKSFKDGSHLRKHVLSKICRPHMKEEESEMAEDEKIADVKTEDEVKVKEEEEEEEDELDEEEDEEGIEGDKEDEKDDMEDGDADVESDSNEDDIPAAEEMQTDTKQESDGETSTSGNDTASPGEPNIIENDSDGGLHIREVFSLSSEKKEGGESADSISRVAFKYGWPADLTDGASF